MQVRNLFASNVANSSKSENSTKQQNNNFIAKSGLQQDTFSFKGANKILAMNLKAIDIAPTHKAFLYGVMDIVKDLPKNTSVIVAPPQVYLESFLNIAKDVPVDKLKIFAQRVDTDATNGVGATPINLLKSIGNETGNQNWGVVLNHIYLKEPVAVVEQKLDILFNDPLLGNKTDDILCCIGEKKGEDPVKSIIDQINNYFSRDNINPKRIKSVAYEPEGNIHIPGQDSRPLNVEEAAVRTGLIKDTIVENLGNKAKKISVPYGGSADTVFAKTALEEYPEIDGVFTANATNTLEKATDMLNVFIGERKKNKIVDNSLRSMYFQE